MDIAKKFAAKLYFSEELAELEQLRAEKLASIEGNEVASKEKFGEITDADGTTWYFEGPDDGFGVGVKLYADEALTEEVGAVEFMIENGDRIIVDENGFVIEIVASTDECEEVEEEATASNQPSSIKETVTTETNFNEEVPAEVSIVEELLTALAPKFDGYDQKFNQIFEALGMAKEQNEELTAQNAELKEELAAEKAKADKFSKMPAAESHRVGRESAQNNKKFSKVGAFSGGDITKHGFKKVK